MKYTVSMPWFGGESSKVRFCGETDNPERFERDFLAWVDELVTALNAITENKNATRNLIDEAISLVPILMIITADASFEHIQACIRTGGKVKPSRDAWSARTDKMSDITRRLELQHKRRGLEERISTLQHYVANLESSSVWIQWLFRASARRRELGELRRELANLG